MLDDLHEVHKYFHLWQRQRYKDGLPYANYHAMSAHLTELKKTTHRHWKSLPSQAIQCELKRIHKAYQRFFNKQGGRPHIKAKHTRRKRCYKYLEARLVHLCGDGVRRSFGNVTVYEAEAHAFRRWVL